MLKYLQMFPETKTAVQRYQPTDRCLLYEAMMDYAFTGEEPTWANDDIKWFIWESLRQAVDRTAEAIKKKQSAGNASAQQRNEAQGNNEQQKPTEVNRGQHNETETNTTQQKAHTESESESDTESDTDTESDEDTENKKEIDNAQARRDRAKESLAMFNRFWDAYPRKTAKQNAVKAFAKLNVDEQLLQTMLSAIERQKASPQWSDPQYIPHPATWLHGQRWEDETISTAPRNAQTNYEQRQYEDRKPGELPAFIREMMAEEAAG